MRCTAQVHHGLDELRQHPTHGGGSASDSKRLSARQAPDKISRKLQADAKEVEQFLLAKDYAKAMETLETYRLGAGKQPLSVPPRRCSKRRRRV